MPHTLRFAAATFVVAAAGLVWASPQATAAACSSDDGVTVVVDFKQLGGGIATGCVTDQGTADDLFRSAGHSLENVQGQAFVCRVDGLPTQEQEACVRTPPANAYWGLFWSDGESGTWTYASSGAYSLDVPDGGAVAFAWQGSSSRQNPGVAPPEHESEAQPSQQPSQQPTQQPTQSAAGGGGTPSSPTAAPSAPASAASQGPAERDRPEKQRPEKQRPEKQEAPSPSAEVTPSSAPEVTETADPPAPGDESALPVWVGPSAVGGLLGVAGVAAYLRRRAS